MSSQRLDNIKYQVKLAFLWSALGYAALTALSIGWWFLWQDYLDKLHPAPKEWPWNVRHSWRKQRHEELVDGPAKGMTQWGIVTEEAFFVVSQLEYNMLMELFERWGLGNRQFGVVPLNDWDHTIPGIDEEYMRQPELPRQRGIYWLSRIGCDISKQSDEWRSAYFEAFMSMARGAQERHTFIYDEKSKRHPLWHPAMVRSKDNPYPEPVGPALEQLGYTNPDIDDPGLVPFCPEPEFMYCRMLTTEGFDRSQMIQIGIAYANWLESCGRTETAEQLHQWSLDLACKGLPDAEKFINTKSHSLRPDAPYVTENLLASTTAMASFLGRTERISQSLNIYLSVLRARRSSLPAPKHREYPPTGPQVAINSIDGILKFLVGLPHPGVYEVPKITGDEPYERNRGSDCEEAAIMAYVGEILFARGNRKQEGLSWTRDATSLAEAGFNDAKLADDSKRVCTSCYETGLTNWEKMIGALRREQEARSEGQKSLRSKWLWASNDEKFADEADWDDEEKQVRHRLAELKETMIQKQLSGVISKDSSWFVV